MMEEKTFYIRVASPVHIGCDEVYDPAGFILNEERMTLITFEPMDFFRGLSAQDKIRYASICGKGTVESIMELYKFMKGKSFDGHRVGACKGLIAQYSKTLSISTGDRRRIQQELNNFSIARTAFHPATQKPYIPGSAIKGALRTAYLNQLAKNKTGSFAADRRDRNPSNTLEKTLLDYQKLENDPFRLLKISDFYPASPCKTKIVYAVNAKKAPSRFPARGPFQILEVIDTGSVFSGTIQILQPLSREIIKTPLSGEKVLGSAHAFYEKEKKREDEELQNAGLPVLRTDADGRICPLRIGRHSGAESLTIEGHRHIKIMKKRGERPDFSNKSTTFWLASDIPDSTKTEGLRPFGWVNLGLMTKALSERLAAIQEEQENVSTTRTHETEPEAIPVPEKATMQTVIIEETWEQASVYFDAGRGGVITAAGPDRKKAEIRGKDKALSITDERLHKKLFDGKKTLPKACVTVRKVGNAWEIVKIDPAA